MANILIKAYTALNLGDDLFVKVLCERYPTHHFYIISNSEYSTAFKKISNLKVIKRNLPIKVLDRITKDASSRTRFTDTLQIRYAKWADAVVYIGGSIFMQNANWQNRLNRLDREIHASKHYFVLGCNFGPYFTDDFLRLHKALFRSLNDICFRDHASYKLFSDVPSARVATDVVFSLQKNSMKIKENRQIIVSVLDLEYRDSLSQYKHIYETKMAEIIHYIVKCGRNVILMNFCNQEGDYRASDRIHNLLDESVKKNVSIYSYTGNIEESIDLICASDGIIANRFHSLILGWVYGINVYPLVYSNKTLNMMKDTMYYGPYTEIKKIDSLDINQLIRHLEHSKPHNINEHRNIADKQFLALDDFLVNRHN